jgi:xyloglucan-specific exo-beta-1,4-glucanase
MILSHPNLSSRALSLCSALLGSLPWCASARTQPYEWKSAKIGGGYVTGVEYHPRQAGLAYARTDVGGAYRRDKPDGPRIALNDGISGFGNDFMRLGVLSLALDPADAKKVYLACGQYTAWWAPPAVLMASSDHGATWTTTELPVRLGGNQDGRDSGDRLAVDPADGSRLLLDTTQDGLRLSWCDTRIP